MEIQIREKCIVCENGIIQNPLWDEFYKAYPNAAEMSNKEWEDATNRFFRETYGMNPNNVPEEVPCDNCDGNIWIYRWIPFNKDSFIAILKSEKHLLLQEDLPPNINQEVDKNFWDLG